MDNLPERIRGAPTFLTVEVKDLEGNTLFNEPAKIRQFSTGSYGWYTSGKFPIPGAESERAQVTVNLTVIGSKSWA